MRSAPFLLRLCLLLLGASLAWGEAGIGVAIPTSLPPSGNATGDLSGTYPSPTVAKINGVALGTTTATAGNLLIGSGTTWATQPVTGDLGLTSGGVSTVNHVEDNTWTINGSADATKQVQWTVANQTTGTLMTINTGAQTASRTLSWPVLGANDTLMTLGTAQTVTGVKTLELPIIADSADSTKAIAFKLTSATTGTTLTISASQAVSHQLNVPTLAADDTMMTTGTAQTVSGVKTLELPLITDSADTTKAIAFTLSGATTGTTLTLASSQTASRTLTIPVLAGADTVATLNIANTFTANQTIQKSSGNSQMAFIPGSGTTYVVGSNGTQFFVFNNSINVATFAASAAVLSGSLTVSSATLIGSNTTLTNNAGAQVATMTNGPTAGNPTKWIPINDNGTTRNIPAW